MPTCKQTTSFHAMVLALVVAGASFLAMVAAPSQALAQASNALALSWKGYADTDLKFSEFFPNDHTFVLIFMPQFPNAYEGPFVAENGSGSFMIGQGDYLAAPVGTKLLLTVGSQSQTYATTLQAGQWYLLAVVATASGTQRDFTVYLSGNSLGQLTVPANDPQMPTGALRFGKRTTGQTVNNRNAQAYGLFDNIAVFTRALTQAEIQGLSLDYLPTLNSSDLLAGYTFDQGSLSPKLSRPVILSGAAQRNTVSASPNSGDAASLPLPTQQVQMTLPYPPGEAVQVIQGYDAANGSHKGYASFCWDFKLADQPQGGTYPLGSNGQPFYAAAPGKVITIKQGGVSGNSNPPNLAEIEQASGEVAGYLHLQQNSAVVNVNDNAAQGQQLALTGDTGAGVGAYHLHFATTDKPDGAFGFVTFPIAFSNYEVRDGVNWNLVLRGIPKSGEVIRARPFTSSAKAFVFLANKVTLKRTKQNTPAGNMHSNGTLTVEKGDPSAYNSNLTAVGKITIQKDNTINGNVTSNTALDNQGTINGNAAVGLINPEPLPGKSYIAGGSNATVPSGGMLALAPSSYGIVTLNGSGVLKLSSGNYYMNELRYPGSEAVIEIDLASGNPVTINVVNNLQLGKEVEIRLLPNGEADSKLVAFNTLQSSQVDVGKEAYFLGALNAPNAKVVLKKNSQLRGAICANEIVVERDCLFLHHDSPGSLPGPGNLPKSSESEESEVSESEVVASYELAQNYPNPFNPSTVISFQLPVDSEASLKIYNLNGQLVKLLVAGKLEAGRHKVVWDGKNEAGVPVASGVYVYVLKAGDFTAQRKLVLMK